MVDVKTEIVIDVPLAVVAAFASNPLNATQWYVNIKEAKMVTEGPLKPGSLITFTAQFLGKKLVYTYEVVEMSNNRFVMKTAEGPFPMETIYEWEATAKNGTHMFL